MKFVLLTVFAAVTAMSNAVNAQGAETVGNSPAPAFIGGPSSLPTRGAVPAYSNGSLVNSPGTGAGGADESLLQDTSLGMGSFGFSHSSAGSFRVADDFTVPAGGWNISNVTFYAYQTGSTNTSTITSISLRIWDGIPGAPGSNVVFGDTTTNVLASTSWSGIYRGLESAPGATNRPIMANVVALNQTLAAGTYWFDWNTGGSLGSGPWAPPVTIDGQTTTGDALQFDGAAWNAVTDVGAQGFPFLIEATAAVSPDAPIPALDQKALLAMILVFGLVGTMILRRA